MTCDPPMNTTPATHTHTQSPAKLLLSAFLRCRFSPPVHRLEDTDHQSVVSRPVASASETAGVGPATNAYSGLATTAAACIPSLVVTGVQWSLACNQSGRQPILSCFLWYQETAVRMEAWGLGSRLFRANLPNRPEDSGCGERHGWAHTNFLWRDAED